MRLTSEGFRTILPGLIPLLMATIGRANDKAPNDAAEALHALFAAEWEYQMQREPAWASMLGDRRWNDRWEDLSLDAIRKDHEHDRGVLERLGKINRDHLTPPDQLNYDLFKKKYETDVEEVQYRWHLVPINQRGGIQTANELADALRFETTKDYEDWIARLRAFPVLMDQTIALMREGARVRMVPPKVVMQRIPAQFD